MSIGTKLSAVKTVVTSKAGRQVLRTQKHSPAILFGAGVVGFGVTVVMASKATLKLDDVLSENERKQAEAHDLHELNRLGKETGYDDNDYKKDCAILKVRLVKDLSRLYAPAFFVGVGSVACLTGSHVILNRRFAGATAAFATLDKAFKDYQGRVTELVGPEKERELRFGKQEREIASDDGKKVETIVEHPDHPHSEYARLFAKDTSTSWSPIPEYNLVFLRAQQTYMNDKLRATGHLFLNEVYDGLGMERTKAGAVTGWVWNNKRGGDNFVDFGVLDGQNFDAFHEFMTGKDGAIWLDFNVDGIVYDLI